MARTLWHGLDAFNPGGYRLVRQAITELKPDLLFSDLLAGISVSTWSAAQHAGVPVLPVSLAGTRQLLADNHWWPRRALVTVRIGEPLEVNPQLEPFAAAVQLRDRARRAIALALATTEA